MKSKKYFLLLLSVLSIGTVVLTSCGNKNDKQINSIEEIKEYGYNLGVLQGTYMQEEIPGLFPKSEGKILVYDDVANSYRALQQGKIDVLFQDRSVARVDISKGIEDVKVLDGKVGSEYNVGVGVSENAENRVEVSQINDIISELSAPGILDDMFQRWSNLGDYTMPDIPVTHDASKPVLKVATSGVSEPFTFYQNGVLTGYDIELSKRIAQKLDRRLEFKEDSNYASLTTEVQSGKAHLLIANLYDTIERRQAIPISLPYYKTSACAIVRDYSVRKGFNNLNDLTGKRIGYDSSSIQYQKMATQGISNPELVTFSSVPDCALALLSNRIDGYICDAPLAKYACAKNSDLKIIPEYIADDKYGFALRKNNPLTLELNEKIAEYRTKGILEELEKKWFDPNYPNKKVEPQDPSHVFTRSIKTTTTAVLEPMTFYDENGKVTGFELDLLTRICNELDIKIEEIREAGNVTAAQADLELGKCDLIFNSLSITEERREHFDLTDSYFDGAVVVVVRNENTNKLSFFEKLGESFRKTFVVEQRWKMILYGLAVTLVMSIAAGILGIILGSGICAIRRSKSKTARGISATVIHLIQGMPAVVLLMILYYVVFGKVDINATIVATIGFATMFGVYSSEIMRSGFDSVDKGQIEAALALGYTRKQAFMKVELPQASYKFIPVLTGEFISMVKMTSIAGYISVAELTRVGDIIRSKTMEAFFPLIVIALIYFGLCELLTFGLRVLHKKLDPKKHAKKVKGVYVINEESNDWS